MLWPALGLLFVILGLIGFEVYLVAGSITEVGNSWGLSNTFMGAFVLPLSMKSKQTSKVNPIQATYTKNKQQHKQNDSYSYSSHAAIRTDHLTEKNNQK